MLALEFFNNLLPLFELLFFVLERVEEVDAAGKKQEDGFGKGYLRVIRDSDEKDGRDGRDSCSP
jgi:hypothetical protein